MRNRAKCKLCGDILESFHQHDYVTCSCGEISIDGGLYEAFCSSKNWDNFLRIDDLGNELPVKVISKDEVDDPLKQKEDGPLSRQDQIKMLLEMVKNIENLPAHVMDLPITHHDLYSFMLLVASIFNSEEKENI